jgi:hypothetical protein
MATGYMLDGWSSNPRQGQEIPLYSTAFRLALGPTQPPIHWVPGALSSVLKGRKKLVFTYLVLFSIVQTTIFGSVIKIHHVAKPFFRI